MGSLSWISDEALIKAVRHLLATAKKATLKASKEVDKNVTDPFAAIFEIAGFEIDYPTWLKSEKNRRS